MHFDVLGPMRVTDESGTRPVAGVRQRILLAALLAHAGQAMAATQLAGFVWEATPPARSVPTLRTYMTRLRRDLGPEAASRILTRDGGYLAEVGPGELDALDFEALCRKASTAIRATEWAAADNHATAALALWRGTPLEDAPSRTLRDTWLTGLEQQRLQVVEWQAEAGLHLGFHEQLVPRLRHLTARHPLRERFHAQLMQALARCGHQAEALAAYQAARNVLLDELGIDPGPELRDLHKRILDGDTTFTPPKSGTLARVSTPTPAVPRQLPAAAGHFTGRRSELDLISGLDEAARPAGAVGGTVVISAIDGMAGVGKTALAVHSAHRLADRFPDGQLFIDLHGYSQDQPPREPAEALRTLLWALGVPSAQIPDKAEECAGLYRQRLAGTRTLIVLDNARSEAQVRPLLPGTPGCLVLVTSRRRLKGLHDAQAVALDVLPRADALALLSTVIAPAHAATDPELAEITCLCGGLPLALRIAGALLRHRPSWTPRYLAGLLRDEQQRLAILTDGDHDLDAVFGLSYAGLEEEQQLLFRRLALVPGHDIDAHAAAALLDTSLATAARLLENLLDHNLLIQHAPGRYQLHDLIRAHARALAADDPQPSRDTALDGLLRYYAHTARAASALMARYPRPAPAGPAPGSAPVLAGPDAARTWLRAERENVKAAYVHACSAALDADAVSLAAGMAEILRIDGPLTQALEVHQAAADAAERHGWSDARATALTDLASVQRLAGNLAAATSTATEALRIHRSTGNQLGEASTLTGLSHLRNLTGDRAGAVNAVTEALGIYRAIGSRDGEANGLTELCGVLIQAGDLTGAAGAASEALLLCRATGNRSGEADALTDLGSVAILTGDAAGVIDAATQALRIYRATVNRDGEANALICLGHAQLMTGNSAKATDYATQALQTYRAASSHHGETIALTLLGRALVATGDPPGAVNALAEALTMLRESGSRDGEAWTLNFYAAAIAALGDLPRALTLYQQSLAMNRELRKPDDEAIALEGIGECRLSTGDAEAGAAHLNQALAIYDRLGMKAHAARIRTRLVPEQPLDPPPPRGPACALGLAPGSPAHLPA